MRHTLKPQSASPMVVRKRSWLSGMEISMYQPLSSTEVLLSHTAFQS